MRNLRNERLIHKLEPKHNRDASYIKGLPGFGTQAENIYYMIAAIARVDGICMHHIKYNLGLENSTISARLNRLQGGKNGTEFPVLIKLAKKQRICEYCKGKSKIVPSHYVEARNKNTSHQGHRSGVCRITEDGKMEVRLAK